MRCSRQTTSEKDVEVVDTSVDKLKLHALLDTESASGEGPTNEVHQPCAIDIPSSGTPSPEEPCR